MIQFKAGEPNGKHILAHIVWDKDYDYYAILTRTYEQCYCDENAEDVPLQYIKEWAEF